jgi:hypothetical protein
MAITMTEATYQQDQFSRVKSRLENLLDNLDVPGVQVSGRLVRLSGMRLEVSGLLASVGSQCWIEAGPP